MALFHAAGARPAGKASSRSAGSAGGGGIAAGVAAGCADGEHGNLLRQVLAVTTGAFRPPRANDQRLERLLAVLADVLKYGHIDRACRHGAAIAKLLLVRCIPL